MIKQQTKREALIETSADVGSGFIISQIISFTLFVNGIIVCQAETYTDAFVNGLGITMIYTIAAFTRKWFWRRFFGAGGAARVKVAWRLAVIKYLFWRLALIKYLNGNNQ